MSLEVRSPYALKDWQATESDTLATAFSYFSRTSCLGIKGLIDIADEYTSTEVKRWYQWKFRRNYECKNKYEINIRKKC